MYINLATIFNHNILTLNVINKTECISLPNMIWQRKHRITVSRDWLPVKSTAKPFGQVRLSLTTVLRSGLTTDER